MWKPILTGLTLSLLTTISSALPQSPSLTTTSTPTPTPIPWSEKVDAFKKYLLTQTNTGKNAGFWSGPTFTLRFPDNDCHQLRFYNWCCTYDIPYKMTEVVAWLDREGVGNYNYTGWSDLQNSAGRYGFYRDPDDGWQFYDVARMLYSQCGVRGPQSACGHIWCTAPDGKTLPKYPEGSNPYVDPNNRNRVCPWLKANGTENV
jgi:hypothetical protein